MSNPRIQVLAQLRFEQTENLTRWTELRQQVGHLQTEIQACEIKDRQFSKAISGLQAVTDEEGRPR